MWYDNNGCGRDQGSLLLHEVLFLLVHGAALWRWYIGWATWRSGDEFGWSIAIELLSYGRSMK